MNINLESLIQNVELFKNISKEEFGDLLSCLAPKYYSYSKGENITLEGEKYKGIGIILSGEVMVTKENAAGNRMILNKFKKDKIFGEMIAFSNIKEWPATVIAVEDSSIMYIEPEKIITTCDKVCNSHNTLILNMLRIISKRALMLNRKVEYLTIKSMREKISTYLIEQYNKSGKTTFMIPLNRNELADFLNVSRPSMSREISKMKEEGIIDYYKSSFKILDIELLKNGIS